MSKLALLDTMIVTIFYIIFISVEDHFWVFWEPLWCMFLNFWKPLNTFSWNFLQMFLVFLWRSLHWKNVSWPLFLGAILPYFWTHYGVWSSISLQHSIFFHEIFHRFLKALCSLFMDWVQLSQGYKATSKGQLIFCLLSLSPQKVLFSVLLWKS